MLTNYRQKYSTNELDFDIGQKLRTEHFIALLILSIVIGFRYEVGVDWEGYKQTFELIKANPQVQFNDQYMEIGFFFINRIIADLGLSYQWMFFVVTFITWYFYFKSLPDFLLPLLLFFLFVDEYFFWGMNGVRQFTAMSIWMLATQYIITKNVKKYILLLLLASLIHRSVLILIPFYFIPYDKLYNRYFWTGLFIFSLIIGSSNQFIDYIESITIYLGQKIEVIGIYIRHIDRNRLIIAEETHVGLGFLFKTIVNLFTILISDHVIKKYPKTTIYFILLFIGSILFNLSYNIALIGRVNNYFLIFRSAVLAISVYHFWHIPRYRIAVIGFCSLYFLLFLVATFNSSNMCNPYRFSFTY